MTQRRVVNNRTFLLALDHLYREAVKPHERGELLRCARQVASALDARPHAVPAEGYYVEDEQLTEYFRLMRALQEVRQDRRGEVGQLQAFRRLEQVASASLYGRPQYEGKLLPTGRDALSQALRMTRPHWTIEGLTAAARAAAFEADDFSLVGLAAHVQDPVVLTALRESVVLYAEAGWLGSEDPTIEWQVDSDLTELAERFVDAFNALFDERLPAPVPDQARRYWQAYEKVKVVGRCVRLGSDDTQLPIRHYHWAVCSHADAELMVREFWHTEVWTTARFRKELPPVGRAEI